MGRPNDRAEWGRWLVAEWVARLGEILESMAGSRPRVDWSTEAQDSSAAEGATATAGAVLWWEQSFTAAAGARFCIGAPEESWSALGRRILAAAGVDAADAAEARSTFLELAGQSLESVANAVGAQLGREVTCPGRGERPEPAAGDKCFRVEVSLGDGPALQLLAVPSPELADALAAHAAPEAPPEGAQAPGPDAPLPESSPMLDLLLDVELPVSISFGRTQLPLKEALKLTTGSIVELNRTVSEPVDIIVNNCVIARGEVVVIEGNYGVRIREIMSREARIRNLR